MYVRMSVCLYIHLSICLFGCLQDKPKEVLSVVDLNVTLNSNTGHPNGMQMVAVVKGKTRSYFVYSESPQVRNASNSTVASPPEL